MDVQGGDDTALADAGVEDLCEHFVLFRYWYGIVCHEFDWPAECADESHGLSLGNGDLHLGLL